MLKQSMESTKRNLEAGFSLVELMVVVTIIGILAGVAVPKFQTFKARASQTEGKSGLNGLYLAMQAWSANYGDYPDITTAAPPTIANVGFSIAGNTPKYEYSVHTGAVGSSVWAAVATSTTVMGKVGTTGTRDAHRINARKQTCQPMDAVTGLQYGCGASQQPQSTAVGTAITAVADNTADVE